MSETATDAREQKISVVVYGEVLPNSASGPRQVSTVGRDKTMGGPLDYVMKAVGVRREVSASDLKNNLSKFLSAMQTVLDGAPTAVAGYKIDEMEIEVEVSAEGGISLLGTGGKVGGKGSITLKLKRS
jgi:hypothetical protein